MRALFTAASALAIAAAVLRPGGAQPLPGPRPPQPAPPVPIPALRAFAADGGSWLWLKEDGEEVELLHRTRGGSAAAGAPLGVARGKGYTDVALLGKEAWILQSDPEAAPPSSKLLRVPLQSGAQPVAVAAGRPPAGGLIAAGGALFWLEVGQSGAALPFLPAAAPTARLVKRGSSGEPAAVAEWPAPVAWRPGPGDLVGVTGNAVYVRVRRLVTTEFIRVSLPAGPPERIAVENGNQLAALHRGRFHWTAASEEATPVQGLRCLRRAIGSAGGAQPGADQPGVAPGETVCDWLPGRGSLVSLPDALYYLGDFRLYRLPGELGPPERVRRAEFEQAASDGDNVVLLAGPAAPAVLPARAE